MAKLCCVFTWLPLAQWVKAKRLRASGKSCSSGHGWSPPVGFCPLWWFKFNSTQLCVNVEGECELFVGSHSFSPCIPSCLFFSFPPLVSSVSPLSQLLFHLHPKFPVPPKTFRSSLVAIGAQEVMILKPGILSLLLIFETKTEKSQLIKIEGQLGRWNLKNTIGDMVGRHGWPGPLLPRVGHKTLASSRHTWKSSSVHNLEFEKCHSPYPLLGDLKCT